MEGCLGQSKAYAAACVHYVDTGIGRFWIVTCVCIKLRLWIFDEKSTYLILFVYLAQDRNLMSNRLRSFTFE